MEKLKVLEGAAQAIHHHLLSFEFLENKSQQLIQHLQIIRNLLPPRHSDGFISKMNAEKVQPAEEVQLGMQRLEDALSRIVRFCKIVKPMTNSSEKEYEFDVKCLELFTSVVNLIITSCPGMEEIVNALTDEENDDSTSTNWAIGPQFLTTLTQPLHVTSNTKKCRNTSERSGSENNLALKAHLDENDGRSKNNLKPMPWMKEALENDVVLLEIFRHSSPADLKNCRLVNRKWKEKATYTLLNQNSLELVLEECNKGPVPELSQDTSSTSSTSSSSQGQIPKRSFSRGSLTDLRYLIQRSRKFPTKSLTFKHFTLGLDLELEKLLRTLGNELKEVTFTEASHVSVSFLRELLLNLAPNLERLSIYRCFLDVRNDQSENRLINSKNGEHLVGSGHIFSLPNLKRLHFEHWNGRSTNSRTYLDHPLYMDVFNELFSAAVNLASVRTLTADFLEVVLDSGRAPLIKELTYEPFSYFQTFPGTFPNTFDLDIKAVEIYQKFASLKPEIRALCVRLNLNKTGRFIPNYAQKMSVAESVLNSILESSKDSLRSFKIASLEGFSIDLPVLSKVTQLSVLYNSRVFLEINLVNAVLPTKNPAFSFQNNFPLLHTLRLCLGSYDLETYFPGELGKWLHPTVKHLTLDWNILYPEGNQSADDEFVGTQMLGKVFPNVTSVVIPSLKNGEFYIPMLWNLCPADLKRLTFTGLWIPKRDMDLEMDRVDSFFTGIPAEICKGLRKWPQRIGGEEESIIIQEVLRTQPSICNLKNLEELNLSFSDFQSDHPFASHVTRLYAFDLMPQLKVNIAYKPS